MITRRAVLSAAALSPFLVRSLSARAEDQKPVLLEMLSVIPSLETVADDSTDLAFGWCDVRGVMASIGADGWPENVDEIEGLFEAIQKINLESALVTNATEDLDDLLGFDLSEVDQGVYAYQPPGTVRVWTGQFDPERIANTMVGHDYVKTKRGSDIVLASPTGDDIALTSELVTIGFGEFNYLIVNEQRIITTARRAMLSLLLDQESADDSLLSSFGDSPLPDLLAASTSALALEGTFLSAESLGAVPTGSGDQLPEALWFAGDVRLEPDQSVARFLIEFDESDASTAAGIIADRFENGTSLVSSRSLSEVLGEVEVSVISDTGIVEIAGASEDFARIWSRMIYARDLAFLTTG